MVLFALTGCSDTVATRYATRSEAEADSLFQRGWLPAIIPQSARDIVTKNNLDLNVSRGEFSFSQADAAEFIRRLNRANSTNDAGQGYSTFTYPENGSLWFFAVNRETGHCIYSMGPSETAAAGQSDSGIPAKPGGRR